MPVKPVTKEEILEMHISNVAGLNNLTAWHKSFILQAMNEFASRSVLEYAQSDDWADVNTKLPELPPPYVKDGVTFTPVTHHAIVFDGEDVFEESYSKGGFRNENVTHWQPFPKPPTK